MRQIRRSQVPKDERQYGERPSAEVRGTLLRLTLEFVRAASLLPGVGRIALLGSIVTDKPRPKDVDLLVGIDPALPFAEFARLGRRLKGQAQSAINSTADIFLANREGAYLGRVCNYRECFPRVLCGARHCGATQHLRDDLDILALSVDLLTLPPVEIYPDVVVRSAIPDDVIELLLKPFQIGLPR